MALPFPITTTSVPLNPPIPPTLLPTATPSLPTTPRLPATPGLPTTPVPTGVPTTTTTVRPRKTTTTLSTTLFDILPTATNDTKQEGASMSGGAIAGLVVGILVVLVCSVIGGFMLLKKRRKRLMGRGQYSGYPDTSSRSRDLKQDDDDDNNESKKTGGLQGIFAGVLAKTQSPAGSKPIAAEASSPAVAMQAQHLPRAVSPPPPVPPPKWEVASSPQPHPQPQLTMMGNMVSPPPQSPVSPVSPASPNYGVYNTIGLNYPAQENNNNSDVLISQPIYLPSTPQDQLSWQQQQQIQQQQLQQQQSQQQQHQYQQQQQYMPVQGYTVGPLAQAPSIVPPQQQQQQHQHQSYQQQPVQMQQIQRSMVSPTIATPVAQPYYYQPGTGLVSVPLSLPSDNYAPQPFQPAQAVTVAPSALNHAHYPAPSVSAASASHVPPPPQQQQQQQVQQHRHQQQVQQHHHQQQAQQHHHQQQAQQHHHQQQAQQHHHQQQAQQHHHQQQVQQHHHQQQQQVAYMPPPPPSATQTTVPTTTAAAPRAVTPESGSIFLPGDSSRLLLSQGLFKIVPDAEDEEEAQRAAVASTSQLGPSPDLGVDLHLGGDFLSSVLNYSSYQGSNGNNNTFKSFSQAEASNIPAATTNGTTVADPGANGVSQSQGQQARQQPGYHDRHAGEKDRPNNQPRYLVDKEEVIREHQGQQNGVTSTTATTTTATTTQQQSAEPVIVGSDIVLEPLPSVKAARKRGELTGGPDSTQSSSSSLLNSNNNQDSATALPQENPQVRKTQVLDRAPTLGEVLPTMGTEEYLERTDDKEEYSARLHGSREPSTSTVVHPARLGELSKEAQGGIVDIGTPITPNAILSVATATMPSPTAVRPSTPVRGVSTPPPLPLSTKPKFN